MTGAARTIVVTGATSGIGEVAALELAKRGARIVFVARDSARAQALLDRLSDANPTAAHAYHLADLSRIDAMRDVAARLAASEPVIDVLVNNAGAVFVGAKRTADGLAPSFALNHLAYFVLTLRLLAPLRAAAAPRIVCTASRAHRYGQIRFADLQYDGIRGYAQSKLANLLFVSELARRLGPDGPTVNALHPGFVATRFADETPLLWRSLMRVRKALHGRTPQNGARTLIWLADDPSVAGVTGGYFADCTRRQPSPQALDIKSAAHLWRISAEITGVDL